MATPHRPSRAAIAKPRATSTRHARQRSDAELIVAMTGMVRADAALRPTIQQLAENLLRVFSASRILIAARKHAGGRALLWTAQSARHDAPARVHCSPLGRSDRDAYLSPGPACWHALRRAGSSETAQFETTCRGRAGERLGPKWSGIVPAALGVLQPRRSCVSVAFEFGAEWTARLYVVDPKVNRPRQSILRLARSLVDSLSHALYNLYLIDRLQTGAAAVERANLGRALHDGVIQSLIAAEMEVHMACQRLARGAVVTVAELLKIQEVIRHQVLGVRDLMQRIKPIQLQPDELCAVLSECVEKFKADTGISCSFFANVNQVSLPPAMCRHVVRIVQEALSNVRKHSGARRALVRIEEANSLWRLTIEDNGRGLVGSAANLSPMVISECVRSLDGRLRLLPAPGSGLLLEITFTGYAEPEQVSLPSDEVIHAQEDGDRIVRSRARSHEAQRDRSLGRSAAPTLEARLVHSLESSLTRRCEVFPGE